MTDTKQFKIYITAQNKELFEKFADINGVSASALMNRLINDYNTQQSNLIILELHNRGALVLKEGI